MSLECKPEMWVTGSVVNINRGQMEPRRESSIEISPAPRR